MSFNLTTTSGLHGAAIDFRILSLAEALAAIHGPVHVAKESSGIHLYMASPRCLEQDGKRELTKRHLAVNASKYFQITNTGQYAGKLTGRRRKIDNCAMCMKTGQPYSVADLLNYPPLTIRGIPNVATTVKIQDNTNWLVDDGRGNKIPVPPGTTVPITELPAGHPAVWYLTQYRPAYDLQALWSQFRCSFCTAEFPESQELKRRYRPLPLDFKDTPQNRIIFFADINTVQRSWQARVIEYVDPHGLKYYLHPYTNQWVACEQRQPGGKFKPLDSIPQHRFEWDLTKYRNARGSSRNDILFGLDAAQQWNFDQGRRGKQTVAGLTEGPLDAGRMGPPFTATTGKFISAEQAQMLVTRFHRIIYVPDTDAAGMKALDDARVLFEGRCDFQVLNLKELGFGSKDLGELTGDVARQLIQPLLNF